MTSACPSPAVCAVRVRRHGSVSARRAGWAACATKVSLSNLAGHLHFCVHPNVRRHTGGLARVTEPRGTRRLKLESGEYREMTKLD